MTKTLQKIICVFCIIKVFSPAVKLKNKLKVKLVITD